MAIIPGADLTPGRRKPPAAAARMAAPGAGAGGSSSPSSPSSLAPAPSFSSLASSSQRPAKQKVSSSRSTSAAPASAAATGSRRWTEDATGMRVGKYSKSESQIVVDAVKQYAAGNSISVEQLCNEGGRKGPLKRAWLAIAECLPERPVVSIYRHGIRQLGGFKTGPWAADEVATLQLLVSTHGKKWALLEKEMGRSAEACRDKCRELAAAPQQGAWSAEEEKLLNKLIMARMSREDESVSTLTGEEKADVPWAQVARIVKTRSRIACLKKWEYLQEQRRQKRLQQEAGSDDKLSANLAFVKALLETGASDESELNWSALPYPRAQLRWKILRGDRKAVSPYRNLGFQQAAKAVVAELQREVDPEKSSRGSSTLPRATAPATTTPSKASHGEAQHQSNGSSSSSSSKRSDEASQQASDQYAKTNGSAAQAAQQSSTSQISPAVPAEPVRPGSSSAVQAQRIGDGKEDMPKEEGGLSAICLVWRERAVKCGLGDAVSGKEIKYLGLAPKQLQVERAWGFASTATRNSQRASVLL
ncbi:unnamed protein product [Pylaiella littoralis]